MAKRVVPVAHSRSRLFQAMADCEPVLFSNFPVRPNANGSGHSVAETIRSGFRKRHNARVRTGKAIEYLPVPRVMDRWQRARAVFGVTDLHYIGTPFDQRIDTSRLNDFNILPRGTDGFQSQDSLVISSTGGYTDSHSDDHSGSNHSFVGVKLWLLWDTIEGMAHGLEDVERCTVFGRAAFDLEEFLRLHSARWILIGPNQTMFIPAHLSHKVITLQQYLGLGSFNAGLPGFVDLLERWGRLPPLWASRSGHSSVEFITQRAIRRLRMLKDADARERFRWGVPYLKARLRRREKASQKAPADRNLAEFLRAANHI
jgi:hypothetical protein